jgi:hypothetical protein
VACSRENFTFTFTLVLLRNFCNNFIMWVNAVTILHALKAHWTEYRHSCRTFLTLALDGGGWATPRPYCFLPQERHSTHVTQKLSDLGEGTEECDKSRPSSPTRSGVRSAERPTRSEAVYRLCYPCHPLNEYFGHCRSICVILISYSSPEMSLSLRNVCSPQP